MQTVQPQQADLFERQIHDYANTVISEEPFVKILGAVTVGLKPGFGTAIAQVENAICLVKVKLQPKDYQ